MAGVKMGQMTYRVRRAPLSPPIPLHSTDWGPEGRLEGTDSIFIGKSSIVMAILSCVQSVSSAHGVWFVYF
eukprot:scaffold6986_cov209-Skeletonema_marinoi.AAC.1